MLGSSSACIPVVDRQDASCGANVGEFFDGYYYCGPQRYVIMPSANNPHLGRRVQVEESNHTAENLLKYLLAVTCVAPAIGAVRLMYNCWTRSDEQYRVVDLQRHYGTVAEPATAVQKRERPPLGDGDAERTFTEFRLYQYANSLLGDYSPAVWTELIEEYRQRCRDENKFLFEMLKLYRDLLNWHRGIAERPPSISVEYLAQTLVPTLLTQHIPSALVEKLREEHGMIEALERLVQHRLKYALQNGNDLELGRKVNSELLFLQKLDRRRCFQIDEAIIANASPAQLRSISDQLLHHPLLLFYIPFMETLLKSGTNSRSLKEVFSNFWQASQHRMPVYGETEASVWIYLLAFVKFEDLEAIWATVPAHFMPVIRQQTIDFLPLRQSLNPFSVKPELEKLLR